MTTFGVDSKKKGNSYVYFGPLSKEKVTKDLQSIRMGLRRMKFGDYEKFVIGFVNEDFLSLSVLNDPMSLRGSYKIHGMRTVGYLGVVVALRTP